MKPREYTITLHLVAYGEPLVQWGRETLGFQINASSFPHNVEIFCMWMLQYIHVDAPIYARGCSNIEIKEIRQDCRWEKQSQYTKGHGCQHNFFCIKRQTCHLQKIKSISQIKIKDRFYHCIECDKIFLHSRQLNLSRRMLVQYLFNVTCRSFQYTFTVT